MLATTCPELEEPENDSAISEPQSRIIWYEDSEMKHIHRELVKAGMEQARQQGKRIGRPRVTERPEFQQRFAAVIHRIVPGGLSRRQVAKELAIGYATLKRLLDKQIQLVNTSAGECSVGAAIANCDDGNEDAGVLY
jgi:hypothetical protein